MRFASIFAVLGLTGCVMAVQPIEGRIPLVMFADVPVPADVLHAEEEVKRITLDTGGGIPFFNYESDAGQALIETINTTEPRAEEIYFEGTMTRTLWPFVIGFGEAAHFDARVVRLVARPLPPITAARSADEMVETRGDEPSPSASPMAQQRNRRHQR